MKKALLDQLEEHIGPLNESSNQQVEFFKKKTNSYCELVGFNSTYYVERGPLAGFNPRHIRIHKGCWRKNPIAGGEGMIVTHPWIRVRHPRATIWEFLARGLGLDHYFKEEVVEIQFRPLTSLDIPLSCASYGDPSIEWEIMGRVDSLLKNGEISKERAGFYYSCLELPEDRIQEIREFNR